MITPDKALDKILAHISPLPGEGVPVENILGRVLIGDVYAVEDLPPFPNSAMDGYAVRAEDTADASPESPAVLKVKEVVGAGRIAREELGYGEAIKIMTGSPLPAGADSVVMVETTETTTDDRVKVFQRPHVGENIRSRGEDVRSGDLLLSGGTQIRPYELAILAAQGITEVQVVRRPRVAVIATGDELVEVSEPLSPGMIRNSNGPTIVSALSKSGVEVKNLGIARDDPEDLRMAIQGILPEVDLLLVSGGVSVGDFDYTRDVLEKLGLEEVFWKVAIKPGKPLLFGYFPPDSDREERGIPVFGLPGNPVSVLVCLKEFIRPAIEKLQGRVPGYPSYHMDGLVENDYVTPKERQQYLFCRVSRKEGEFRIHIIKPQGSAMLGMACRANALAVSPIGMDRIKPGIVLPFRWLK
jgi:molybdopterin molybdotransferase